jgi:hypothetical protein
MSLALVFLFVGFIFLAVSDNNIKDIKGYNCDGSDKNLKLFDDS